MWTDAMTRSRRTGDRGIERSFVNGCCAREIAHEDARRGMAGDANVSRASREGVPTVARDVGAPRSFGLDAREIRYGSVRLLSHESGSARVVNRHG